MEISRETIVECLSNDYYDYLNDMTIDELELISRNGVFTLREAKHIEQADKGQ